MSLISSTAYSLAQAKAVPAAASFQSSAKLNIVLCGLHFAPEQIGIGKYTGELADRLAAHGHCVQVVTAPPHYPHWAIADGYKSWRYTSETSGNLNVVRCPLWVPRTASGLKRIVHLASFGLSSIPAMLLKAWSRPDIVFVVEPSFFCLPVALITARLSGAKAWLHVQDFEIDAAFELGILKWKWLKPFAIATESLLLRRFDRVSSISPNMVARLLEKGVDPQCARLFPNWVDCKKMFPLDHTKALKDSFGIPATKTTALYAGNMGEKQGIEIVIDAAKLLSCRNDVHFVLCGSGAAHSRLRNYAGELANLTWLPIQDDYRFNELMNAADIHILPQRSEAADLVMPSKLTGMLATGRPIVASAQSGTQLQKVVEGHGITVEPGNAAAFARAIEQLTDDPQLRLRLGRAGREYAINNLSTDSIVKNFFAELEHVIAPTRKHTRGQFLSKAEQL